MRYAQRVRAGGDESEEALLRDREERQQRWAEGHGLRVIDEFSLAVRDKTYLDALLRGGASDLLDHPHLFARKPRPLASRYAAVVSCPYINSLNRTFGDLAAAVDAARALASDWGMSLRVGHHGDWIYRGAPRLPFPTLPFTFWDPRQVTLGRGRVA